MGSEFTFGRYGDWSRAGVALRGISNNLTPAFKAQVDKDGEMVLKRMVQHIESQDLGWTPLNENTIALKHGDDTIYVETGFLKNNLKVRKISAPAKGYSVFIGANPWVSDKDGVKLSDLLIYLEYGTVHSPARPLVRPTWDEVSGIVKQHMRELLKGVIRGEVRR